MEAIETTRRKSPWGNRLAAPAAIGLLWAGLHYLVSHALLTGPLDRPTVVLVGDGGPLAAIAVLAVLLAGALIGELLCNRRDGTAGLLVIAFGAALWALPGGTMDDWLIAQNPTPGPAAGAAYRPLIAEHLFWAVALAAVMALSAWKNRTSKSPSLGDSWRRLFGPDRGPTATRDGVTALIVATVVTAVLIMILSGPRVGHTYRGQVYFSVAAACALGVFVSERVTGVRAPIWYLPAPSLVGLAGALIAMSHPGLPGVYQNLNVIPATGLVRALPIELVGVGTAAIVLTLRTVSRLSSERGRG